jgi:protein tyrosine/serine phosphatase
VRKIIDPGQGPGIYCLVNELESINMKKSIAIALGLLGLVLMGGFVMKSDAYVQDVTEKDFKSDNFHTVREGRLYRSGQIPAARLPAYLKKFGIKTIINLRSAAENMVCCRGEEAAAKVAGATVAYAPMSAGRMSTNHEVAQLLATFDKATEPLLIHCSQGINRTGEACALWLLVRSQASKAEALTQFDAKYGYVLADRPEKRQLIENWKE